MVVAITGGGSRAIAELLEVPGGSRTLLEAVVPYSAEALVDFLGGKPEQFCSARTARAMAMAGFQRARRLQPAERIVGIGCTASLVSDRPKRGAHRIHVAFQTAGVTSTHSLELVKDLRSRTEEESIASSLILNCVAEAFGVEARLTLPLKDTEQVELVRTVAPQGWQDLLLGRTNAIQNDPMAGGKLPPENCNPALPTKTIPRAVFPGAYNPLHAGHRRMAEIAARRLSATVHFEISVENVDKLPLDYTEMQQRAAQFEAKGWPLWFTRAPTFEEKSAIFPGATFIVGADTLVRIGQPCYYHDDPATAEAAIDRIADRGCRFLVFGRVVGSKFQMLDDLPLPPSLRKLCDAVPADEFRADVSSTQLRERQQD
jgi:nicotinamide mononucleotide (NMN) deamidase PncC